MQPFIHLHVHSQYSILDGQASIPALVDKAIRDGMKGLALTDHGNMFGIKEFFNLVKRKTERQKMPLKVYRNESKPSKAVRKRQKTKKKNWPPCKKKRQNSKPKYSNRYSGVKCT